MRKISAILLAACGSSSPNTVVDSAMQDPNDPVEDVPAFTGAYSLVKLTTDDSTVGGAGTFFNDDATSHMLSSSRMHFARYRDGMVLQDKVAAKLYVYDQAATTIGDAIALPSDATGRATIRGGLLYVGGLGKVYSYELASKMWRLQPLPDAGQCHHVAAGATRLFVVCATATANTDAVYSTWASVNMTGVAALGTISPAAGAEFGWITAAPGEDVAYLASASPDQGCIARADTAVDACAISLRTLTSDTVFTTSAQITEDGKTLYVDTFTQADHDLREVPLATPSAKVIEGVTSFATCPDGAVEIQNGTLSFHRAGGVTTPDRLGEGGQADLGCPLKKL